MSNRNLDPGREAAARVLLQGSPAPSKSGQAVLWWQLVTEAEMVRAGTGQGLAGIWGHINRDEYEQARAKLDVVLSDWRNAAWMER
jgi:hypothetical protein